MKKGKPKSRKRRRQKPELETLRPFWDQGERRETLASKEEDRSKKRRIWPSFKIT